MDQKKFEKLIDLIINENEDQARELFHEIVVEKSRQIYESIMDEEMHGDMEEGMGGQVGDLMDEITAEESGMVEGEDEMDMEVDDAEEVFDMTDDSGEMSDMGDMGDMGGDGDLESRVEDVESKLDQLMAEFEEIMSQDDDEVEVDDEEEIDVDMDDEDMEDEEEEEEDDEEMMEAVQLQKVSVTHGDDGAQKKSPNLNNSGQKGMDSKPVKFSGHAEAVPNSPKAPSNAYAKGETQVKGAGSFKNSPGHKTQALGKAPAPHKAQATGVNVRSPVAKS